MIERLCTLKYQAAQAYHEVSLLKEKIHVTSSSPPKKQQTPQKASKRKSRRLVPEVVAEDRQEMMASYMRLAEKQMNQAAMDYEHLSIQVFLDDHHLAPSERLPLMMHDLVKRRLNCIDERVACWYKLKIELVRFHPDRHALIL